MMKPKERIQESLARAHAFGRVYPQIMGDIDPYTGQTMKGDEVAKKKAKKGGKPVRPGY